MSEYSLAEPDPLDRQGEDMAVATAELTGRAVLEVEAMLAAKAGFDSIETRIEQLDIPEGLKSALWLLAWAETDTRARRRVVRSMVSAAAH